MDSGECSNEITAITATTGANWVDPTYDASGNMITGPTPEDETATQKYVYDAWYRLVKVTDGSDVAIGEYAYDGRNYRITKAVYTSGTLSHTDHFYYNENWQALEVRRETSGTEDPDPREQHVWHPDYIDALAVRYYDADTDGNLAEDSDGTRYYTQGANYHVLAITNATGTILERYHYDPYGQQAVLDPNFTPDPNNTSDIDNPYTFTGRRLDPESGIHYFRNRYFDASTGRFLSRDPMHYFDGMNLYASYFAPNHLDPFGLDCHDDFDKCTRRAREDNRTDRWQAAQAYASCMLLCAVGCWFGSPLACLLCATGCVALGTSMTMWADHRMRIRLARCNEDFNDCEDKPDDDIVCL